MTTKVTVDAHAGWPVQVTTIQLGSDGQPRMEDKRTVAPNTTQEFYVHSHAEIHIKEMPRDGK